MENKKASFFQNFIINLIVLYLKKYKDYYLSDSKNKYVVSLMDNEEFKEYCEFKSHCYIIYENEKDLLQDNPKAKRVEDAYGN